MSNKKKFFDKLKQSGELILDSKPFANWLDFFKPVDEAHPNDEPGFSDYKHRAQYDAMEAWGRNMNSKLEPLGASLNWDIDVSSYCFAGSAAGPFEGEILADGFPIDVNLRKLPKHSLSKSARVNLSLNHEEFHGTLTFRQQYGEPFLDDLVISKETNQVSERMIKEFKKYSIECVSQVEPLEELAKKKNYDYSEDNHPNFFFKPTFLTTKDLTFVGKKVFLSDQKIIADYLTNKGGRDFIQYNVDEIDTLYPYVQHIKTKEGNDSDEHTSLIRNKIFQAFVESYKQRNLKVAEILTTNSSFEPLNKEFYLLFRDDVSEHNYVTKKFHLQPDSLNTYEGRLFPQTYIIKFGPENKGKGRDFTITYRRESFGDYCVWMRPEQAIDKVLDTVSNLGF